MATAAGPEALVAIFRAVEDRYGYLPERALRRISDRMSIHWAQVFGAAGLGGFRLLPATGHVVTVCDCAACRFAGGPALLSAIEERARYPCRRGDARRGVQPGARAATSEPAPIAPAVRDRHARVRAADSRQRTAPASPSAAPPSSGGPPAPQRQLMANAISPQIRILAGGERRVLTDIGRVDPTSLGSYREHGGYAGLERAVTQAVPGRGHRRDRGGRPARPRRLRLPDCRQVARRARNRRGDRKIAVANLMGADPSALGDRALAEGNPHLVVEGLLVAAYAIGAGEAIVAVRRDWTLAIDRLRTAVREADRGAPRRVPRARHRHEHPAQPCGRARAPTSRARRRRCSTRWPATAACRPSGRRTPPAPGLWGAPDGRPERRDARPRGVDRVALGGGLRVGRHGVQPRNQARHDHGSRRRAGADRGPARASRCSTCWRRPAAPTGTPKAVFVGGPGGGAIDVGSFTTAYDYEPLAAAGAIIGSGSVLVADTVDLHGRRGPLLRRLQRSRGLRQGRAVPDRDQAAGRDARPHPGRRRRVRTTSRCCASCRAR